jgi:4-alpha-glucanotransferase
MKRKSGVLLPISALMSEYGIGDFGAGAYTFIDYIAGMGFSVWQVLPITTIGAGNSPYSGISSFAGNYLLIDLEGIPERLLTRDELNSFKYTGSHYRVNYEFATEQKRRALNIAFSRLNADDFSQIDQFVLDNKYWLEDYATYMTLCEAYGNDFYSWEDGLKLHRKPAIARALKPLADRVKYYYFEQFLFFSQWHKLKSIANERGVLIFGDMPIYLALQSADVWTNSKLFELDSQLNCKRVAGVPPDYFSETGQMWGNPLYNYKAMEKDNFSWWCARIQHNLYLYDLLRIDHFRGLFKYWAIPATARHAKDGEWLDGPKFKLWETLANNIDSKKIIAEDLGIIDDDVRDFLNKLSFPGMRVLQFAFDGKIDNPHLPYNYDKNVVAYTATHDNDTTLGWLYRLDISTRDRVLSYIDSENSEWGRGGGQSPAVREAIKEVIASTANIAIIPFQDLCGYGSDTRINIPGVPLGNWEYRTTFAAYDEIDTAYYLRLNRQYGRTDRL